ncbi:MAG: hypothetical protein GXO56_03275 [Chloroflexi bacterium]|nr:hypothetical protein [Chloroflexota bacterium]
MDKTPDYNQQIQDNENAVEKFLSQIPGFQGYRAKEHRRDADKLLRLTVAQRVDEQWRRLTEIQRQLAASGDFQYLDDLEAIAIRLRTFSDQVRTASYGYAGFFDALKVDEAALASLYEFDGQLLALTDQIRQAVDRLEQAVGTDELPNALRDLLTLARQSIEVFNRREEVLLAD